jgi:hydrogenase expression/formation protein HypC
MKATSPVPGTLRAPCGQREACMCLAIPMVLVERNEFEGVAEIDGVQRRISVIYVPEAEVGDFVLVHAGFAIGQVDADEAAKTLELLREYADAMADL